jgi:hypothetical protein
MDEGFHTAEERRRKIRTGICQRMCKREREATPIAFRDLLISMARTPLPKKTPFAILPVDQTDDADSSATKDGGE